MIFVDGSWLYRSLPQLAQACGKDGYVIDYGKLPGTLGDELAKRLGRTDTDIVRTHLFGSYPSNYDEQDEPVARATTDFFNLLREEFHYEVDLFAVDFGGNRIRPRDRDPDHPFEPREKCVDVALATSLVYYATVTHAYDVAIVVIGDRDYTPALQQVRRLGKRVAVASIKGCCARELSDPVDRERVKDVDIMWLNDLADVLELRYESVLRECQSPHHQGDRRVPTTYRPRKNRPFYCDDCRRVFAEQRRAAEAPLSAAPHDAGGGEEPQGGETSGKVDKLFLDHGYGFVRAEDGRQYFFHRTDAQNDTWPSLAIGEPVSFIIRHWPAHNKAGRASDVRKL
jgi:cold shock CspA family protein